MKKILSTVLVLLIGKMGFTQNVGIGTDNPAPSAMLQISATNKGVLVPGLTNAQMNAIASPATGLIIFNVDHNKFYYYNGAIWTAIVSSDEGPNSLLAVSGKDSLTMHNLIVGDTSSKWTIYRDSIAQTKKFQISTGVKGELLQSIRTEKYGVDYTPYGKASSWNRYITRNWYNSNGRPGEILTLDSYNTNGGGGVIFQGEGAWSHVLESEWNRQFEDYVQVSLSTGYSYRPFAMYIDKDIQENDITFRSSIFHINPVGVAQDCFNVKNGKMVLTKVQSAPSEVSNTLFSIVNGSREISMINNTNSLFFSGAASYAFDNTIIPSNANTSDCGINSARWKNVFTNTIVTSYTTVADADHSLLATELTLNFKNITADRKLILTSAPIGGRLEVITGQGSFKVIFQGTVVKNIDGTTAASLPAGKSCTLSFDGTNWWVVAVGEVL